MTITPTAVLFFKKMITSDYFKRGTLKLGISFKVTNTELNSIYLFIFYWQIVVILWKFDELVPCNVKDSGENFFWKGTF
jgi:hypothetical protein